MRLRRVSAKTFCFAVGGAKALSMLLNRFASIDIRYVNYTPTEWRQYPSVRVWAEYTMRNATLIAVILATFLAGVLAGYLAHEATHQNTTQITTTVLFPTAHPARPTGIRG